MKANFNQKGQEFEVFNMLIGAVIALAILFIIIGVVNYFEGLKLEISNARLEQKISSAAQSPNGSIFPAKDLTFKQGYSINAREVALKVNLGEECINFDAARSSAYRLSETERSIIFDSTVQTDAYIKCYKLATMGADCPKECLFCCTIAIGKEPE